MTVTDAINMVQKFDKLTLKLTPWSKVLLEKLL